MKVSKNQLKQVRYFFEYILALPLFFVLKFLTFKQKSKLGSFLGRHVMYPFVKRYQKKRYNILKKNIGIIYKQNFTPQQEDEIIKDYCSNTVKIFTESFAHKQMTEEWLKKNIQVSGAEKLAQAYKDGKKIILTSAHIGNWEVARQHFHTIYGIKMTVLYRKQNNTMLDEEYMKVRQHAELIEKRDKSALKKMIASLNERRMIVALLDQPDRTHGTPINLFGKKTYFPSAITKLAMRNDAVIFCGYCHRNPENQDTFTLTIEEPVQYNSNSTPEEVTQDIFRNFEKWIAKNPTQWFCMIQDIWK